MARNTLRLDTKGLERLLIEFEGLGGDVNRAVEDALKPAAEKIRKDTIAALSPTNLPARGKYSSGDTLRSVITDTSVQWEGQTAWVPVGFNFSEPGAGGYLITGTPRMKPDQQLNTIYKKKKYMNEIQKEMSDVVMSHIIKQMEKSK